MWSIEFFLCTCAREPMARRSARAAARGAAANGKIFAHEAEEERAPRVVWVSARSEAARTAVRRRSPWDIAKSEFMVEEVVVEERED